MRTHLINSIAALILATEHHYRANPSRDRSMAVTAGYRFRPSKEILELCFLVALGEPSDDNHKALVNYYFENYDLIGLELFDDTWQTTPLETLTLLEVYGRTCFTFDPNVDRLARFKSEFYSTGNELNSYYSTLLYRVWFTQQLIGELPALDEALLLGEPEATELFSKQWENDLKIAAPWLPESFLERWNRKRVIFGLED